MEDTSEYFDNWGADDYADDFYPSMFEGLYNYEAMKGQEQLLSQVGEEKEQLEGFVKPLRIYYDDSEYYAYVLLDGDIRARDETIKKLDEQNIRCIHTGQSYRPANDGNQYQWFIRVIEVLDNQCRKPNKETINDLFVSIRGFAGEKESKFTPDIQQLQLNLRKVENEKQEIESKLEIKTNELADVQKRYEILNVEYSKLKKEFENQVDSLSKENKDIKEITEVWQTAENQMEQLKDQIIQISKERDIAISKIEKHKENEKKIMSKLNSFNKSRSNYTSDFDKALSCLLDNLHFHKGSISFLLRETKDITGALRTLKEINSNSGSLKGTRIEGADLWKELKFNTGQGRIAGRIYYGKSKNSKLYKYHVLVSHKNSQELDIKRLKNVRLQTIICDSF